MSSVTPEQSGASGQAPPAPAHPMPAPPMQTGTPGEIGAANFSYMTNSLNQLRTNGPFMLTLQPIMKKILQPLIAKADVIKGNAEDVLKKLADARELHSRLANGAENESANAEETQEGGALSRLSSSVKPKKIITVSKKPSVKPPPKPLSSENIAQFQSMINQISNNQSFTTAIVNTTTALFQPLGSKLDMINKMLDLPKPSLYGPPEGNASQGAGRRRNTRRIKSKSRKSRMKKRK
jgi:hypothetical protein